MRSYEIKPGDSRQKVADILDTTVPEMLAYNKAVLGDDWTAGVEVRNPNAKRDLIRSAIKSGATAKQIAAALKIKVSEAEGLIEAESKIEEAVSKSDLSEIADLPSRRGGGEILNEAVVPQRSGRFPEVTPTQRGQIPIPQPDSQSRPQSLSSRR